MRKPPPPPGAKPRTEADAKAQAVEAATVGSTLVKRYRLDQLLESSGSFSLFLGEDVTLSKRRLVRVIKAEVAAKPAFNAWFFRVARKAAALVHQNVAAVVDMGTLPDGSLYMVSERAEGTRLDELLAQETIEPERAARLVRQIAAALEAAHATELAHGGLSATRVIVSQSADGSEAVKVSDFAVAKLPISADESSASQDFETERQQDLQALDGLVRQLIYDKTQQAGELPAGVREVLERVLPGASGGVNVPSARELRTEFDGLVSLLKQARSAAPTVAEASDTDDADDIDESELDDSPRAAAPAPTPTPASAEASGPSAVAPTAGVSPGEAPASTEVAQLPPLDFAASSPFASDSQQAADEVNESELFGSANRTDASANQPSEGALTETDTSSDGVEFRDASPLAKLRDAVASGDGQFIKQHRTKLMAAAGVLVVLLIVAVWPSSDPKENASAGAASSQSALKPTAPSAAPSAPPAAPAVPEKAAEEEPTAPTLQELETATSEGLEALEKLADKHPKHRDTQMAFAIKASDAGEFKRALKAIHGVLDADATAAQDPRLARVMWNVAQSQVSKAAFVILSERMGSRGYDILLDLAMHNKVDDEVSSRAKQAVVEASDSKFASVDSQLARSLLIAEECKDRLAVLEVAVEKGGKRTLKIIKELARNRLCKPAGCYCLAPPELRRVAGVIDKRIH